MYRFLFLIAAAASAFGEVPASVLAEPNPEKRSELALKAADEAISAAAKAYQGEADQFQHHLKVLEDLTRLSLKSLQDTGKRASKSPKYFKRAELKLRSLMRRMSSLSDEVSVDDRPRVQAAMKVMSETHELILQDIMAKR